MSHPNSKSKTSLATLFPFSMRDLIVTALILFVAVTFCILLQRLDPSAGFATPVFVLTVLLTSRLTTGYFWGLFSAVLGVIAVNFFFTFPYWAFNLTITGYPLSFLTFLSVSVITSALTTKTRQLDKLRMENEKIRMRADLLRSVSHDIRTPLTSIIGSTSAVLDNPNLSQEDRRSLLEDVKQEAQWLIRTVENLLSITRIGSDRTELNKQLEPVEEVLAEAVQKARKRLPDIKFSVEVPAELLMVPMDPILIEQVLSTAKPPPPSISRRKKRRITSPPSPFGTTVRASPRPSCPTYSIILSATPLPPREMGSGTWVWGFRCAAP